MRTGAHKFSCAIIVMSDKGAAGLREDTSGKAIESILKNEGYNVKNYQIIPDDVETIATTLTDLTDNKKIDLVITTGGTGVAPRDVTPEAMKKIIDVEIPGMAEAMRAESLKKTPYAVISRAMAGRRGESLIINLPGSKRAATENIAVLLAAIPHTLEKIQGEQSDCGS